MLRSLRLKVATISGLNAVENRISNVSDLLIKTDYDAKISDIGAIYFAKSDYNKVTGE